MRQKSADDFIQFIDRRFNVNVFGRPSETQAYDDNLIYYIVNGVGHQDVAVDYFNRKGFKIEFKYKRGRRSAELAETDKVISQVIISIKK
jgi:outer membrane protein assembly factor BamE (lipoprotein component of BamABCDE complex)